MARRPLLIAVRAHAIVAAVAWMAVLDPGVPGALGDAAVVGRILLANGSPGAGVTDGTGGQGIKPLPIVYDGWIQPTVALVGTGRLSPEVEGWIARLTEL